MSLGDVSIAFARLLRCELSYDKITHDFSITAGLREHCAAAAPGIQ